MARHLTLRTSIIGTELRRHSSLLDWFLAQDGTVVRGFDRAIYSGVTTVEFARFLREVVLPSPRAERPLPALLAPDLASSTFSTSSRTRTAGAARSSVIEDFACDRSMTGDLPG